MELDEKKNGVEPERLALRPREAAEALGIGGRKLWELSNRGMIPFIRVGRAKRYPIEALRQWLTAQVGKGVESE